MATDIMTEPENNPEPEAPWLAPDFLGQVPPLSYGYIHAGGWTECSLQELQEAVARDRNHGVPLVWTPVNARLVPPADVPELHDAVRRRLVLWGKAALRRSLINGLMVTVFFGQDALKGGSEAAMAILIITVIGVIPAAMAGWSILRAPQLSTDTILAQGPLVRMSIWLSGRKPFITKVAIGCVVVVALSQLGRYMNDAENGLLFSMLSIGLLKLEGQVQEWWRLFTAIFAHAGLIHLGFNCYAFWVLGRRTETLAHWAYVPIVFLAAGLCGCLTSLVMKGDVFSVGASGGVIGLMGFLLVFSLYNRKRLPKGMLKEMLGNIGLIAVIGVIGIGFIDNAGHFGGLLGGALVAVLLLRPGTKRVPLQPNIVVKALAVVCTAVCALTALFGAVMVWIYDLSRFMEG